MSLTDMQQKHIVVIDKMLETAGSHQHDITDIEAWNAVNMLIGACQEISNFLKGDHQAGDY